MTLKERCKQIWNSFWPGRLASRIYPCTGPMPLIVDFRSDHIVDLRQLPEYEPDSSTDAPAPAGKKYKRDEK